MGRAKLIELWQKNRSDFKLAAMVFGRLAGKPSSAGCLEKAFSSAADLKRPKVDPLAVS